MKNMQSLINRYIASREKAWAPSTLKSEASRLSTLASHIDGNPERLWTALNGMKPYARVTAWTRVGDFWRWASDRKLVPAGNPYSVWREENAQVFKGAYEPKLPSLTFEQAEEKVAQIANNEDRAQARQLLEGGLRFTESLKVVDGHVKGKGAKTRKVFVRGVKFQRSYRSLLRSLKSVGLTPHMLRKVCATTLARKGLKDAELCAVFGWSSFATAKNYIAPVEHEKLQSVFNELQGGSEDEGKQVSHPV
jgi:integrase